MFNFIIGVILLSMWSVTYVKLKKNNHPYSTIVLIFGIMGSFTRMLGCYYIPGLLCGIALLITTIVI